MKVFFTKKRREFICVRVSKAPGKLLLEITATAEGLLHWLHGFWVFTKLESHREPKVSARKGREILSNSSGNFSTWKCSVLLIFQTLTDGLLLSTRVYFSFGYCHLDVPLPGCFPDILVHLQSRCSRLLRMVKDWDWLPILKQDSFSGILSQKITPKP